jgi:hypothetical protein
MRRRTGAVVASAVAVVGLIASEGGELTARQLIRDRVAAAAPALGRDLTVSEGGGPALWDLARRDIPTLDIGSDDAEVGSLSAVSVQAQLDDVRLAGRRTVAAARVEVTVPPQALASAVQAAVPSASVSSVTAGPGTGTITMAVGPAGLGQLTLHAAVVDGRVSVTVAALTVFGRSVPPGRLGDPGTTTSGPGSALGREGPYPLGLKATSVLVLPDGGLRVALSAGPGPLPTT